MFAESVKFAAPAIPTTGATIVLWDSTVALGAGRMKLCRMTMLEILFVRLLTTGSAANGLVPYCSTDLGANWRGMDFKDSSATATMPVAVAALAAGANKLFSFVINNVDDFKVEFTAQATVPATWELIVTGTFGGASIQK